MVETNTESETKNDRLKRRKSTKSISEETDPAIKARKSRLSLAPAIEAPTKRYTRKSKQINEEIESVKKTEARTKRTKLKSPVSQSLKKDDYSYEDTELDNKEKIKKKEEDQIEVVMEGQNEKLKRRKHRIIIKPDEKTNESLNNEVDSFSDDLKETKNSTNKQGNTLKLFFHSKRRSKTVKEESKSITVDLGLNSTPNKKFKLLKSKSLSSENLNNWSDDEGKKIEETKTDTVCSEIDKCAALNEVQKENEAENEDKTEDDKQTNELNGDEEFFDGNSEKITKVSKKPRGRSKSMISTGSLRSSFRKNTPKILSTGIALTEKQKQVN